MSESMELPQVGDLLAEKYRILRLLGQGGMGAVYQAHHEILDRTVAIKFLLPTIAENPQAVARFLNEARASARLNNEHVAAVLDVGSLPNGCAFMVLEYLEGADLAQTLVDRGALPVQEAVEYVLQALEAIAQAHAADIIHRDLKPANLFLTRRSDGLPTIKVLDFGISKANTLSNVTATSSMLGSPAYMSPEQIKSSKHVDPRSDIWSIGVILYQLLTAELPFKGEQFGAVFAAIFSGTYTPIEQVRAGLPPALCRAVAKCLEQERENRFQNVGELAEALKDFAFPEAQLCVGRIHRLLTSQRATPTPGAKSQTRPLPVASVTPSHAEGSVSKSRLQAARPATMPPAQEANESTLHSESDDDLLPTSRNLPAALEDEEEDTAVKAPARASADDEAELATPPRSRTPLIVGGVIGALALAGVAVFASGILDTPPATTEQATTALSPAHEPVPTPKAEPAVEPPKQEAAAVAQPTPEPATPTPQPDAKPEPVPTPEPTAKAEPEPAAVPAIATPEPQKPADAKPAKPEPKAQPKPKPMRPAKPAAQPAEPEDFLNDRQ